MEPEHGDEFTKLATEIVVAISDFAQQSVAMALRGDRATGRLLLETQRLETAEE